MEDNRNILDKYKNLPVEVIRQSIKRNNFSVAACNLDYNVNIGTMMRTCNAFAGREFLIIGRRKWDRRASVGVQNYENVIYLPTVKAFDEWALKNKRTPVAVDFRPGFSIPTTQIDQYPQNPVFIFGNEGTGLPDEIHNICQLKVFINQFGSVRSLNVAMACGMIIYDWRLKHLPKDLL